jgi:hypothetical protein
MALIGVYMPFDDPSNRIDSLNMFETTMANIVALIERFSTNNIPILIIGDFNSDSFRGNRFDTLLSEFISDNSLVNLSSLNVQSINHTFTGPNINNKSHHHSLDHALLIERCLDQFENIQCNILDDILNLSDHKALSVTFEIDSNINMVEKEEHITSNINLADPLINQEFKRLIMLILDSLSPEINSKVIHTQESIDIFYEKIIASILNAERSTIDFQSQLYPHRLQQN